MQISSTGSITGAVGTQELWIWEAGSAAPISLGVYGGSSGFVSDLLTALTSNKDIPDNALGLIQWPGSPAITSYTVIDEREANKLVTAGDYWLATASRSDGYATWGVLPSGSVEWNPATGDSVAANAIQADGSCVVGDGEGNQEIRWSDGTTQLVPVGAAAVTSMHGGYVLFRYETAGYIGLMNRDGEVIIQRVSGSTWPLKVLIVNNIPWIVYYHESSDGRGRVIIHPYNDATMGSVVTTGDAYGLDARIIGNTVHFAWGLTAGEAFNSDPYTDHIARHSTTPSQLIAESLSYIGPIVTSGVGGQSGAVVAAGAVVAGSATSVGKPHRVFRPAQVDPSRGAGAGTISEVPPSYAPQYPYNTVLAATESGHLIELDDTPGAERIHIFHRSGSHIEVQPDGTTKYKSAKLRQDVTLGDHDMIIRGDWTVTVDGSTKVYVRGGSLEIQADNGAAINVTGELKLHADNIMLKAKQKISLSAPFVDIGDPVYMSLPANIATLYGVPIPIAPGLKVPVFSPSLIAKLSAPLAGPAVMAAETLKFIRYGQGTLASLKLLKTLAKDLRTREPIIPEISQPTEIPLSSPGVYRTQTTIAARTRDRLFDTPDDVVGTSYEAHIALCQELGDYAGSADIKVLPGQIFGSDLSVPADEPLPPNTFQLGTGEVSITTGGVTMTGTNTSFLRDLRPGQTLLINDVETTIAVVQNNTSTILRTPWTGASIE